ncbi:MAG: NUDIX domain-containing protein [Chloroflexota bacterium]|nr:NUDIX domain-containing protein [Chloroflexota bacterium]
MSLKFYLKVIQNSLHNPLFRAGALHETWDVLRQYLPARLVTPRSQYVFCSYGGKSKQEGRWVPPLQLHFRPGAYALIFDEQERLLMVTSHILARHWYLPGGGLNKGETLVETLRREVREETGLEIEVGPVVDATDFFRLLPTGRPVQAQLHYYLARPIGGKLQPQGNGFDSTAVNYFDLNESMPPQLQSPEELLKLVKRARLIGQALGFLPYSSDSPD